MPHQAWRQFLKDRRDVATLQLMAKRYVAVQHFHIAVHNEMRYKSVAPGPPIPSNHLPGRLIEVKP
jgi:hypothetical protein